MTHRHGAGFVLLSVALTGCHSLGLSHDVESIVGKPVETPKVAEASVEAAARVDAIGRELLGGTPLGIPEIAFQTVGSAEPELFHHDSNTLYITEGLVNLCKRDDELAAVLATEIGRMTAEFRRTARKQHPEPIPEGASPAPLDRASGYDPGRELYLAQFEKSTRRPAERLKWPTVDPTKIAEELMRNAGHDGKLLKDVTPQLKLAARNHQLATQLGGRPALPRWGE